MKTLQQQRNTIFAKINEIERMKETRNMIDMESTDERGFYINVDAYLSIDKKINYAKGSVIRMIKRLLIRMYDGWSFSENYDYIEAVKEFKRFAN